MPEPASAPPLSTLRALARHLRRHRGRVWLASACSVLNKLFDIAPEILIGVAVDVVARREDSFLAGLGITDPVDQLWLLGGLTLAIWVLESVFEYLYLVLWRNLAQTVQHELRLEAYGHLQALDVSWVEARSPAAVTAVLNDDINQLERFLNGGANELIQVAVTVIAIGGIFFWIAPDLAWVAFTPIPVIVLGAFWFTRRVAPRYDGVREMAARLGQRIAANVGGLATIKSHAAETREAARVEADSLAYVAANRRAIAVASAFIPIIRMAILFGFLATFVWGGLKVLDGSLREGFYAVLVFLTQRLLWPLTRLAETVDLYERAMASTRRVLAILDEPVGETRGGRLPARFGGALEFDDVGLVYPDGRVGLASVSCRIAAGSTVAFVGATGAGKSTLFKLVLGLLRPTRGSIRVDGADLASLDPGAWRAQVGWVAQDVFLFDGSVRDNIAYARPDADDTSVRAAARAAAADEFIESLPDGYATRVGDRAQLMSGGQRQRLALARAVLKDPPLLLLDEATSAVDNETEAAIQRSLRRIAHGRTVLVIAHRLSTVVHADMIHVLDAGRIVESGRHADLVAAGGAYAALWRVQTGHAADAELHSQPTPA